ncbi:sugar-binding protein [Streptomyces sp. CC53]|uniref:ricin-type beta-trefoil lectin domain protein n=1 Tax=Streptomyces sp. CC53 TaxID=1906740 RepID=UPI0008DDE09A|nr:ricin-type beta-trefoil lectin domain protein [Streptomyces sp. CC53]OII65493.1 sugar-binding protein [Streptomyces sp. CC53]
MVAAVTVALTAGLLPTAYAAPPVEEDRAAVELVELPERTPAEGQNGGGLADTVTAEVPRTVEYEPTKTAAPPAASATETVTGLTAGETVQVGTLPVEVGAPETATAEDASALEGDWQVALADEADLGDRDVSGLVFTVTPPASATGEAVLALDYTEFAELYGAHWADRLQLTRYPACFLTTPDVEGCSEPAEVDVQNVVEPQAGDVAGDGVLDGVRRVEAVVDVATLTDPGSGSSTATPATATSSGTVTSAVYRPLSSSATALQAAVSSGASVFTATSAGSGAKGDFSATPLVSAGSWAAGNNSGAFTYTYDLQTPSVPAGPSPSIAFGYNSQVVDGRTSATNNQASWIGDGWEYNPGSITRSYRACRDDRTGANNADRKTGDLCWGSHNATLTLGGTTTELVKDDTTGEWVTANGDGSRVELLKDSSLGNGDKDGEHWRVTTRDGTQYHFGLHKLPGWTAGSPTTNSVLWVPVAGNQPGEPCYDSSFAASFCEQAWRWNLDYVVDPQGNAMSLWWGREDNHYGKNLKYKEKARYIRGGYLTRIDYGQRADSLFTAGPIARVEFKTDERCFKEGALTCDPANFTSGDYAKSRIWYDTPADLYCSAASGKECFVPVPTFWTRKRLAEVTTLAQRTQGSEALSKVDSWTLSQSLPAEKTDEGTALWLESITRHGYDTGGTSLSLRPVQFVPNTERMPNRVKKGASDPNPTFDRLRLARIVNEYAGETVVTYRRPEGACASGSGFPKPHENTGLCFPAYWHPDPDKSDETIDWFNKYVVDQVQEMPAIAGGQTLTTSYEYLDGGAWALNQAEFSKKKTRTYDQWRGFSGVLTVGGDDFVDIRNLTSTQRSASETRYFRGMDGDPLPGGTKRSVTVVDGDGEVIATDHQAYQGRVAETRMYTRYNGDLLTRSVDYPTVTELASRARDGGIPPLKAYRVQTSHSTTVTRSSGTGKDSQGTPDTRTWRTLETSTTHEPTYGLPVTVESLGDTGRTGDETCSVLSYVHNTSAHLIGLSKETLTTAGTCAEAATATPADWISGSRVAYDGGAFGAAPAKGLATTTWNISGDGGGWTQNATLTYDAYGRSTSTTDAQGNKDTTTYTPSTGQVYQLTSANALGHTTTSTIEPGRGTTLTDTDTNGRTTVYAYDALGRTTKGWATSQSAGEPPSVTFTYNLVPPVSVVTSTLGDDGTYSDSVVFYDGLGRERQRQTPAVGEGRLITDVLYSANGTIQTTNNAYYATGEPRTVMFEKASDFNVPNATYFMYDGLGRLLAETPVEDGTPHLTKQTRYAYGYDHSTVIEPEGGASQRSWTDALGRTIRVDTFTDAARNDAAARSTTYAYDARGDKVKAEDHLGNTWTWAYDARGRQVSATDPDTGTTTTTYDVLDRPVTTTDARGVTVWTGYDKLSRPTSQRLGSSTGTLLSSYTYDSVLGGIGLPAAATRYTDGLGYTTEITGYTSDYQPTGKRLRLPASIASASGLEETYAYQYEYTKTGLPKAVTLPAAGALPAERVVTRYNDDGLPVSTSGLDWYTAETHYSVHGEVLRTVSGEQPHRVWTTNLFDERTGELKESYVDRESTSDTSTVPGHRVNHRTYGYDPAGNVTTIADTSNGVTDRQCFTYDVLGQLTKAWTAPGACRAAGKTEAAPKYEDDDTLNVTAAGGGYWKEYVYDAAGNRSELTEHHITLAPDANTPSGFKTVLDEARKATTSYRYGGPDGTQPHTLTSMTRTYVTDEGAQVTSESTRTYDASGNTVARQDGGDTQTLTWTWDGKAETVTGFGAKGAGAWVGLAGKCLDLSSGSTLAGTPLQLYLCNGTKAQKLRIDGATPADPSTGALKILDHCVTPKDGATADGTAVVIADCTGTADQRWTTVAAGAKLRHEASGKCLTVPGAATANGTDLVLAACDTDGEAQSWVPADETRYVYDASGGRLMAVSAGEHTLYLGDTTVATTRSGAPSYTERYYAQPGAPTVMRHVLGNGAPTLSVQVADQNGTAYTNVMLAEGNGVQISRTDPFGVKRAQDDNWRAHRGYVGGDDDTGTGLVHLGAREYDPHTGRFLSADPVLDLNDPVQLNGYVYSENNPVTYADPSGLASEAPGATGDYGGPSSSEVAWANKQRNTSMTDIIISNGAAVLKGLLLDDIKSCISSRDLWACGSLAANALPGLSAFRMFGKIMNALWKILKAVDAWRTALAKAEKIIAAAKRAEEAARKAAEAKKAAALKAAQAKLEKAKEAATRAVKEGAKKTGNAHQKAAKSLSKGREKVSNAYQRVKARITGKGGGCKKASNSFTPGTLVLMADGTTKPIEDVKNGDKVLATDPETGETTTETVSAKIKGEGLKHLVKVTVDTDGDQGGATAMVTATDGHPFWVPELGEWIDATDLKSGQWLQTSAGTYVQITAIQRWTAQRAAVHNLTVTNLHTYYVLAGATPVLVHNCNGATLELKYKKSWDADQIAAADRKVAALNASDNLVVTKVERSGSAADMWRRAGNKTVDGSDIDHIIELQLGGADDVTNMTPLDSSVNRSIGSQIARQLKKQGLKPGDVVCQINISRRC